MTKATLTIAQLAASLKRIADLSDRLANAVEANEQGLVSWCLAVGNLREDLRREITNIQEWLNQGS